MTMRTSWLVQRLSPSQDPSSDVLDSAFAFGGGLRNGGLSSEAMDLLRKTFTFEYMGAAEFEFGAVPRALRGLAIDESDLSASTMSVDLADVPAHWRDRTNTIPDGSATIYVLCRADHLDEVEDRILGWATGAGNRTKGTVGLTGALRPDPDGRYTPETCGWMELDNGFFFFTDREMWRLTCALFNVQTPKP